MLKYERVALVPRVLEILTQRVYSTVLFSQFERRWQMVLVLQYRTSSPVWLVYSYRWCELGSH